MPKLLLEFTDETIAAIDAARGTAPRAGWLENQLWKLYSIKKAAGAEGIEKPDRPLDGRGNKRNLKQFQSGETR